MALSAFDDKSKTPGDDDLAVMLGSTFSHWNELKAIIASRYSPISFEWGYASKSTGWGLRAKGEKRTILYMTPCKGYFLASFTLGEKAVKAAHVSALPPSILEVIDGAKRYVEGRAVRLEVRSIEDAKNIEKFAIVKMAY